MPQYVVQRLVMGLNSRHKPVHGSRVLLLGLAYKKNVGDLRESPAMVVADLLRRLGAEVRAVEPYAEPGTVEFLVDLTEREVARADAVVVLADHDVFDYAMVGRVGAYVFDTRDRCSGPGVELL
jgi:UDP-N-acetyl-D-glucosamine dehydrogenase